MNRPIIIREDLRALPLRLEGIKMHEIEIKNLTKRFEVKGLTITALDNISLSVEKGDIFGIIGMSGAGKSTLVRSINYLERPTEGQVFIHGVDLATLSERELRHKRREIGMIFQNFNLLEQKNSLDNVCFPLEISGMSRKEARKKARELLATVNLSEKEKAYPSQLSGGSEATSRHSTCPCHESENPALR